MTEELLPCPFCGGEDIRISDKTTTINRVRKRHVACYCNACHCYGSRIIGKEESDYPYKAIDGTREEAIKAWNTRVENK